MAALYISIGIVVGGISAVIIMAMLFVSKEADENQNQTILNLNPVKAQQEIPEIFRDSGSYPTIY